MNDFSYEILDILKKYNYDEKAALAGETNPQCLYALSPLRENMLEWFEFEPDARVLQIGSDYGSVTGILAERTAEVVVLDPLDENLEVNRLRHQKHQNVIWVRGDLRDQLRWRADEAEKLKAESEGNSAIAVFGRNEELFHRYKPGQGKISSIKETMFRGFDYVVFANFGAVCEKEEAKELLMEASNYLKPGGVMIAAVENETGVRYWMGAERMERSYLEAEFRGLFEAMTNVWGGAFTMYYPVPDFRYPASIYSDHYLPEVGELTNLSARLDAPGVSLGSEEEAMAMACQNGMFKKFNNSFLGVWEKGTK